MSRHRRPFLQLALAVLALWLGLWPTADAVTGTSQFVVVAPLPPAPVPNCAATECVLAEAATLSCCQLAKSPDAPASTCCGQTRDECARCFSLGGVVLFAVHQWTLEPDLVLRGILGAVSETVPTRSLQPPVPPPLTVS